MISIKSIDHFVLTVKSIDMTVEFYQRVLGMSVETFGEGRVALCFGSQKINLHQAGKEFEPKAQKPTSGSGDFCLLTDAPIVNVVEYLNACGVKIEDGPIERTGATGPIISVYFRDPDMNLVEVSHRL